MTEELVTINETKKELKCGHTKAYELINGGQLKAVKLGRHTRILRSSIDTLIASLPAYRSEHEVA